MTADTLFQSIISARQHGSRRIEIVLGDGRELDISDQPIGQVFDALEHAGVTVNEVHCVKWVMPVKEH